MSPVVKKLPPQQLIVICQAKLPPRCRTCHLKLNPGSTGAPAGISQFYQSVSSFCLYVTSADGLHGYRRALWYLSRSGGARAWLLND